MIALKSHLGASTFINVLPAWVLNFSQHLTKFRDPSLELDPSLQKILDLPRGVGDTIAVAGDVPKCRRMGKYEIQSLYGH
jgi:hypothetical protein